LSAAGAGLFIALEHLVFVLFLQKRKPDFASFRKCRKAAGMDVIDPWPQTELPFLFNELRLPGIVGPIFALTREQDYPLLAWIP
jgi:hypothetical protein